MIKVHLIKSLKINNIAFKNINLGLLNKILKCVYIMKTMNLMKTTF